MLWSSWTKKFWILCYSSRHDGQTWKQFCGDITADKISFLCEKRSRTEPRDSHAVTTQIQTSLQSDASSLTSDHTCLRSDVRPCCYAYQSQGKQWWRRGWQASWHSTKASSHGRGSRRGGKGRSGSRYQCAAFASSALPHGWGVFADTALRDLHGVFQHPNRASLWPYILSSVSFCSRGLGLSASVVQHTADSFLSFQYIHFINIYLVSYICLEMFDTDHETDFKEIYL